MNYPEVVKAIAAELKTARFNACWVSPSTWNQLRATTEGLEEHEVDGDKEYAVPLITAGRRISVFCDPTLEDGDLATAEDEESEET